MYLKKTDAYLMIDSATVAVLYKVKPNARADGWTVVGSDGLLWHPKFEPQLSDLPDESILARLSPNDITPDLRRKLTAALGQQEAYRCWRMLYQAIERMNLTKRKLGHLITLLERIGTLLG